MDADQKVVEAAARLDTAVGGPSIADAGPATTDAAHWPPRPVSVTAGVIISMCGSLAHASSVLSAVSPLFSKQSQTHFFVCVSWLFDWCCFGR